MWFSSTGSGFDSPYRKTFFINFEKKSLHFLLLVNFSLFSFFRDYETEDSTFKLWIQLFLSDNVDETKKYPIIPGLSIFWGPMEKFTLSIAHHRFESRAYNSRSRWRYPRITMWCSFYCYLRYHIKYINQIIKISIKLNNCYFYIE